MTRPILWTDEQISAATHGVCSAPFAVHGVSIDTRSLAPGDLFVALPGSTRDGHAFVDAAFAAGAAAALVCKGRLDAQQADGALVEVEDVQGALEALARAARARSSAYITAVTGSVACARRSVPLRGEQTEARLMSGCMDTLKKSRTACSLRRNWKGSVRGSQRPSRRHPPRCA